MIADIQRKIKEDLLESILTNRIKKMKRSNRITSKIPRIVKDINPIPIDNQNVLILNFWRNSRVKNKLWLKNRLEKIFITENEAK